MIMSFPVPTGPIAPVKREEPGYIFQSTFVLCPAGGGGDGRRRRRESSDPSVPIAMWIGKGGQRDEMQDVNQDGWR
jgi:hypothetical protein